MRFGEKVRDLRKKNSLTQDELAKCLGVSKRTIIGWERDGRYPRNVEILEKMADIFHVPLTYIQPDQSLFIERAAATYGTVYFICFSSQQPHCPVVVHYQAVPANLVKVYFQVLHIAVSVLK